MKTDPLETIQILENVVSPEVSNILRDFINSTTLHQKQEQTIEDRVESLENEIHQLKTEREIVDSMSYNEGDIIYAFFSTELESDHMGEIVAIDIENRKPVGYGANISDAFLQAKIANPDQDQFYFRKVGRSYLEKV